MTNEQDDCPVDLRLRKKFQEDQRPDSELTVLDDDLHFDQKLLKAYGVLDDGSHRRPFSDRGFCNNIITQPESGEVSSYLDKMLSHPEKEPKRKKKGKH